MAWSVGRRREDSRGVFKMQIPFIKWINGIWVRFPRLRALALPVSCLGGARPAPLCWTVCRCIGTIRTHGRCHHITDRVACQTRALRSSIRLQVIGGVLGRTGWGHRCGQPIVVCREQFTRSTGRFARHPHPIHPERPGGNGLAQEARAMATRQRLPQERRPHPPCSALYGRPAQETSAPWATRCNQTADR